MTIDLMIGIVALLVGWISATMVSSFRFGKYQAEMEAEIRALREYIKVVEAKLDRHEDDAAGIFLRLNSWKAKSEDSWHTIEKLITLVNEKQTQMKLDIAEIKNHCSLTHRPNAINLFSKEEMK